MKRTFYCCLLIGVVFMAASAIAADLPQGGCTLQGSWWSNTEDFQSLATDIGESASSGTMTVELFGANADATLGGQFKKGVKISTLRGVWERTAGNTFAYTQVWYGLDAANNILWIGKNSGIETLSEDCNLVKVDGTFEVFSPEVNPFEGTPFFVEPLPTIYYHRMKVNPPATIPQ